MKNQLKKTWLMLLMVSFGLLANAQKNDFTVTPNIGVTTPILDNGIGFHVGINPAYALSSRFSVEGQISYLSTKINGGFLSGDTGQSNAVNTLIGGRVYLSAAEKTNRFYLNFLVGGNYLKEEINNIEFDGELDFGFSAGAFFELNKFLVGVSYDTPQNLILKVGYIF